VFRPRPLFLTLLLGLLGVTGASADEGKHVFWEVTGKHNTLYLLGSVHLLHNTDRALPSVTEAAYLDAETVVEELDLFAAVGDLAGGPALALQTLPQGKTLAGVLGAGLYARLQKEAAALHIDTDFLSGMQPWYVAMLLSQTRLTQQGFSPFDGVDYQIAERARRDQKPLRGLETAVEQLSLFANLSLDEQREFLLATLDEPDAGKELAEITAAWRRGDLSLLESLLRKGAAESPAFFKALTTDRNLRWLPEMEKMLADPVNDYLVVTGALHMVGDNGLVALLRKRGYKVEQK
jgi:uncharacterized protein YbaP (TraB family)